MTNLTWIIFIGAALLEVGGDAVIRKGIRGGGLIVIVTGFIILGCYGLVVNMVQWDFSRLLGVYVAFFALISLLTGRIIFKENITVTTFLGIVFIVGGGLIIQWGDRLWS